MFEKYKELDLKEFGVDEPVRIKRLSAKEQADLTNEITKLTNAKLAGKTISTDLQPGMFNLLYAEKVIAGGPLPADRNKLGELDWELVAFIAEEGQRFNSPLVMKVSESE